LKSNKKSSNESQTITTYFYRLLLSTNFKRKNENMKTNKLSIENENDNNANTVLAVRLLDWEYLESYQRAEYKGFVYYIERGYFGKYQLLIKVDGNQNHITGGQTVGKIKRIAEKDLKKRLDALFLTER
jgi:hypothetical protein